MVYIEKKLYLLHKNKFFIDFLLIEQNTQQSGGQIVRSIFGFFF